MKKNLLVLFCAIYSLSFKSQSAADAAVQLSVSVQNSPAQITLNWVGNATTTQYQVYRKLKTATSWGTPLANLIGTTNQYSDNTVSVGINYEYRVIRTGSGYSGYGYINSGIKVPEIDWRGKLILIIDSNFITPLSTEISRFIKDVEGDGWEIIRHDVLRTGSVTHIKNLIVNDYAIDSAKIKGVFLIGHIPVPYSGNINPDGHPDHLGAWPADVYYGDVDGVWTDAAVTSTTASPLRTQNMPGDGKFDQSIVPGNVELQVGRVDFNGMPTFTLSEQQLLKNYLDKNHDYRKKIFSPIKQAVIDDNFGYFGGEAFAASGFKNFGPLVGFSSVSTADYFTSMTNTSYAWSFGCGGGTYTSAGGIGNTGNFASSNLQGVFTMLFGSYFGDWDSQNNFLKAPLAQGKVLTNVWSGRPHYQFHHMALGENIGYGLLLTQNNPGGLYFASPTGITGKWIHNALMGDPTLRSDVVSPVSNVIATKVGNDCQISWSASTETTLVGYNIYMKNDTTKTFVKVNSAPIIATTYTDNCLLYKGVYTYMVRALKLENTASGTYYNMSEGIADTAYNSNDFTAIASFTSSISGTTVQLTNTSTISATYSWDFGNGVTSTSLNPSVSYTANGSYVITLIASHPCYQDTTSATITIIEVGIENYSVEDGLTIFPNPTGGKIKISFGSIQETNSLFIYNVCGEMLFTKDNIMSDEEVDLSSLNKGIYVVQLKSKNKTLNKKIILE